jgi:hypothetical protein
MADIVKPLAQNAPGAGVLWDLYTVPASRTAVVSSLVVCNTSANPTTWRCALAIGGAADALQQYLYYEMDIPAYDTFIATIGITLSAGDIIRVRSVSGTVSFNLSGVEET